MWGWPVEEVLYDSREIFWIGYLILGNAIGAKIKDSDIFINRLQIFIDSMGKI